MKQFYIILVSFLMVCFFAGCAIEKDVFYERVIEHQVDKGGTEIFDKVIVYRIKSERNSEKDSICYYKNDKYLGSTVIQVNK